MDESALNICVIRIEYSQGITYIPALVDSSPNAFNADPCHPVHSGTRRDLPANTRRWSNAGLMLSQRRRRWPNIKPALDQRLVCAGLLIPVYIHCRMSETRGACFINLWKQVSVGLPYRHLGFEESHQHDQRLYCEHLNIASRCFLHIMANWWQKQIMLFSCWIRFCGAQHHYIDCFAHWIIWGIVCMRKHMTNIGPARDSISVPPQHEHNEPGHILFLT